MTHNMWGCAFEAQKSLMGCPSAENELGNDL